MKKSLRKIALFIDMPKILKLVIEAEADDVVGAGVGLLTEGGLLVVVAVE